MVVAIGSNSVQYGMYVRMLQQEAALEVHVENYRYRTVVLYLLLFQIPCVPVTYVCTDLD